MTLTPRREHARSRQARSSWLWEGCLVSSINLFLDALAIARRDARNLTGLIVGDGPERSVLGRRAGTLGLLPDGVTFAGARSDVPRILARASILALTSDVEGFPNVLLEGMASRLPVVTTPAGDAAAVIVPGESGFVVPFGEPAPLAEAFVGLARSPALRRDFGDAGRRLVEVSYGFDGLAGRLLTIYADHARRSGRPDILRILSVTSVSAAVGTLT